MSDFVQTHKEAVYDYIKKQDDGLVLQAHIQSELDKRKAELIKQAKEYFLTNLFMEPDANPGNGDNGKSLEDERNAEVKAQHDKVNQDNFYSKVVAKDLFVKEAKVDTAKKA